MSAKKIRRLAKKQANLLFAKDNALSAAMSENNSFPSQNFEYTPMNNLLTLQNAPSLERICNLLLEMQSENRLLRAEVSELKKNQNELKVSITKLTEEVISVKLENRKLQSNMGQTQYNDILSDKQFPFNTINEISNFNEEVQKDNAKLNQFKQFIGKTGGEGATQFLRAAIRKVFSDELASAYSWKGTSVKPSAEKCFLVTLIKNICHTKYNCTDKDMNSVLQKFFVHAKDRATKRKRLE